jgi:hypothetical protein
MAYHSDVKNQNSTALIKNHNNIVLFKLYILNIVMVCVDIACKYVDK